MPISVVVYLPQTARLHGTGIVSSTRGIAEDTGSTDSRRRLTDGTGVGAWTDRLFPVMHGPHRPGPTKKRSSAGSSRSSVCPGPATAGTDDSLQSPLKRPVLDPIPILAPGNAADQRLDGSDLRVRRTRSCAVVTRPGNRCHWVRKSDAVPTGAIGWSHMVEWTGESGKLRNRLKVSHPYLTRAACPAAWEIRARYRSRGTIFPWASKRSSTIA